jgi:hypothetical protein
MRGAACRHLARAVLELRSTLRAGACGCGARAPRHVAL